MKDRHYYREKKEKSRIRLVGMYDLRNLQGKRRIDRMRIHVFESCVIGGRGWMIELMKVFSSG